MTLQTSPAEVGAPPADSPSLATLNLAELEQIAIREAIRQASGNMSEAARLLGINRLKLYRKAARGELAGPG